MGIPELSLKPWIVQKYGGTSLGKLLDRICGEIIPSFLDNHNVAVVCSAISGKAKNSGTTSLLLECLSQIESPAHDARTKLNTTMDIIRDNHLSIIKNMALTPEGRDSHACIDAENRIQRDCDQIQAFMLAAQTVGELSPRSRDRVLALGENLACLIVATALTVRGVSAEPIYLDNIIEEVFGPSLAEQRYTFESLGSDVYPVLAEGIAQKISRSPGRVPIITGFFGILPNSLINTVGRGYSDLCAALCAVGLGAQELQIWKEVDGIFTADPRKINSARLLPAVTFEEASELTYYGSEVIHPLTMDQVRRADIRLQLKNVFNPSGDGTRICPTNPPSTQSSPTESPIRSSSPSPNFMLRNGYHGKLNTRRTPTAVTVKDQITVLNVICKQTNKSPNFLLHVFQTLAEQRIVIDLVTSSEKSVSLALERLEDQNRLRRLTNKLNEFGVVTISEHRSIVSIVGHKMKNMVGVSSEIFSALATEKINVYMISQGASEINISVVVRADQALQAMDVIHQNVLKIPSTSEVENSFIKGPWLY